MQIVPDIKSISSSRRETLRKQAYEAHQNRITGHEFAKTHKIYSATVYSWYKKFDEHGTDAI